MKRLGLSRELLESEVVDESALDVLEKGGGYSTGPRASHKYWRRTRVMEGGKLTWRYYYRNEKDRKKFFADRDKAKHRKRLAPIDPDGSLHHVQDSFQHHFEEFKKPRVPLSDLTAAVVTANLKNWRKPPSIEFDELADAQARAMAIEDNEPDDLWAKAISPLRAVEAAYKLLPDSILNNFDGAVKSIRFVGKASSDEYMKKSRKAAGYCTGGGDIVISLDRTKMLQDSPHLSGKPTIKGGNYPVGIVLHEMAHAFAAKIGDGRPGAMPVGYKGPNWKDWQALASKFSREKQPASKLGRRKLGSKNGEKGITDYAEENLSERFAETFTAACMTPVLLAEQCPLAYDFMHKMMPDNLLPRDQMLAKEFPADQVLKWVDPWSKPQAAEPTIMQTFVSDLPEPQRAPDVYKHDPDDLDALGGKGGSDRFYEMNYRGRTLFLRMGAKGPRSSYSGWEPSRVGGKQSLPTLEEIKEVYDEKGNPVPARFAYLHLIQDVIDDNTVMARVKIGKKVVSVTPKYIQKHGGLTSSDPAIEALLKKGSGKIEFQKILRAFAKGALSADLVKLDKLRADRDKASGNRSKELSAEVSALEKKLEHSDWREDLKDKGRTKGGLPMPVSMMPSELTSRQFRQRSGTFNYDRWAAAGADTLKKLQRSKEGSLQEAKLLDEFRKVQPGLSLKDTRWPKGAKDPKTGKSIGGQFRAGAPYMVVNPITRKREPAMDRIVYANENPDGTKTNIVVKKENDGSFRIENQMWRELLTPMGEEVKSAEHLATLCKVAARKGHRAWISVQTDRERFQKKGKIAVAPPGDVGHSLHMEVEFDGAGQPRILGKKYEARFGTDRPRLDHLLKDDPLGETLPWAKGRKIIPAEQIRTVPPPKRKRGELPSDPGSRIILTVGAEEQVGLSGQEGKKIVVRLLKKLPGKKAGDAPSPPGWDRMPEGVPNLDREAPMGQRGKLSPHERDLVGKGHLPPWYVGTKLQKKWYHEHYKIAYTEWKNDFERLKAEAYEPVYVFTGEVAGGAGGRTFRRVGDNHLQETMEWPVETSVPEALTSETLAYLHKYVDARTGATLHQEIRVLLPKDGSETQAFLETIPGIRVRHKKGSADEITLGLDDFANMRAHLGGLSLTSEVDILLERRSDMLKAAEKQRLAEAHEMELEHIQPAWLADNWDAGLNKELPNGAKFTLARHQAELLQKMMDNDGRVLAAHYMGTGKTISALAAIKLLMARRARVGVKPGEGVPKDLVGDEREKWLADHPFDPDVLDPRNPKRVLVVAPLNTVEQWRDAASDFDESATVVGSGANDIPIDDFVRMIKSGELKPDTVVVGPEYFTIHQKKLKECGFDGLVVDEVHQGIKNEVAERNKVVRAWNKDMKMMMLLTGTPMTTSPTDFVEYVRLLSNGAQWGDMDKATFTQEYLMPTPIPAAVGQLGGSAPKLMVRPEKRAELAAILSQYMHIALSKDVIGKVLPAVRIADNKFAHMEGAQANLYNLYMAKLGAFVSGTGLEETEIERLGPDAKRHANAAKAVANCIGYTPGSADQFMTVTVAKYDREGHKTVVNQEFRTPDPRYLMSKKSRGKNSGKWQSLDEVGAEGVQILNLYCQDVLGLPYEELAGKPIGYGIESRGITNPYRIPPTAAQRKEAIRRMEEAEWIGGKKLENPDSGDVGIRFRGVSIPWDKGIQLKIDAAMKRGNKAEADRLSKELADRGLFISKALEFQRAVRHELQYSPPKAPKGGFDSIEQGSWTVVLKRIMDEWGIDRETADSYMNTVPNPSTIEDSLVTKDTGGMGRIKIDTSFRTFSDKKGSLHLQYLKKDWDEDKHQPKSRGGFDKVSDGDNVTIPTNSLAKVGIKKPGRRPEGMDKDEWNAFLADWAPPTLTYDASIEPKGDKIGLRVKNRDKPIYVDKKLISAQVRSLSDPGMRMARVKSDVAMTYNNAKSDMFQAQMERFHDGAGAGPDGERQIVCFGNGILDSCRTMEAKLRLMGYRDVNEVIEGSPHFDPTDKSTKGGSGPTGKYFVTYIGSTYTGSRELNVSIFKKMKNARGGDSKTSVFVDKCLRPRKGPTFVVDGKRMTADWQTYPGDVGEDHLPKGVAGVQMSQMTPETRDLIKQQFKIDAPEAYVMLEGKNGVPKQAYFKGAKITGKLQKELRAEFDSPITSSQDLLRLITRTGDPSKMEAEAAAAARKRIAALKKAYAAVAAANATTDPPLSGKQVAVFNNCEVIVCSDAAQVGMNFGNSTEQIQYDSLGSPMAEEQRITRNARMLPEGIPEVLMGTPIMAPLLVPARKKNGEIIMAGREAKMIPKLDDNGKPIKVHQRDEFGRYRYKNNGPFDAIRKQEAALFSAENRSKPVGTLTGMKMSGDLALDEAGEERRPKMVMSEALSAIAECARARSEGASTRKLSEEWASIASKAELAGNMGGVAARQQLVAFKDTKAPGGTETLVDYPTGGLSAVDPEFGTYGWGGDTGLIDVKVVETAIGNALSKLSAENPDAYEKIMKAGFTRTDGPGVTTIDPTSVYLAIRSNEILGWIDANRGAVAEEMRSGAGGEAITNRDIQNRLIDMLSPEDRAILKQQKYLVNVQKLGASGAVGQVITHKFKVKTGVNPETGKVVTETVVQKVHTGYENEWPVSTEVQTRTMGRARMVSQEQIFSDVQSNVEFKADSKFERVTSRDIASVATAIEKALRIMFDLRTIDDNLDLLKGDRSKEGSRGGHVIGHTSSGKAIYASHNAKFDHHTRNFGPQDHTDAADLHDKLARSYDTERHAKLRQEFAEVVSPSATGPLTPEARKKAETLRAEYDKISRPHAAAVSYHSNLSRAHHAAAKFHGENWRSGPSVTGDEGDEVFRATASSTVRMHLNMIGPATAAKAANRAKKGGK